MNDIKWLKINWDKDELSARGTQIKRERTSNEFYLCMRIIEITAE